MAKIAILTEDDSIWALSMWERTVVALRAQGHDIVGICAVRPKVGSNKNALEAYLRLGVLNLFKVSVFAIIHKSYRLFTRRASSICAFSKFQSIPFLSAKTPNDPHVLEWFKAREIDIIIMSQGHILKDALLEVPRLGVINRHAGLLPENKGLMPYLWAVIEDIPHAISYHVATRDIDAGAVLYQTRDIPSEALRSMIAFYAYVHIQAADMWGAAIEALMQGESISVGQSDNAPRSMPTVSQMVRFHRKAGCIMRFSDVTFARGLVL